VISEDQGLSFENAELDVVGSARKVIVGKDATTIIEGAGSGAAVRERVAQIRAQAANASSDYDRENYDKRAAAIEGKVAVIKVGGATETEINEKKYRVDDAVAATKAALTGGIVAGGGVTLVNLAATIKSEAAGAKILKSALSAPFRQLMSNAGLNAEALLAKVESAKAGQGIDVNNADKGLVDVKAVGIVDPAVVAREAVQNAVSIAATAMTMGALVVDIPEKETPAMPAMGGGGMGY
jgi:chaperonin GroEL